MVFLGIQTHGKSDVARGRAATKCWERAQRDGTTCVGRRCARARSASTGRNRGGAKPAKPGMSGLNVWLYLLSQMAYDRHVLVYQRRSGDIGHGIALAHAKCVRVYRRDLVGGPLPPLSVRASSCQHYLLTGHAPLMRRSCNFQLLVQENAVRPFMLTCATMLSPGANAALAFPSPAVAPASVTNRHSGA